LTTFGLISAIHRILYVISGNEDFAKQGLYRKLEEILEQPIISCLRDPFMESTETGLDCLTYLSGNQDNVSERMWNFFNEIVTSILGEKGILETELSSAMTPLCIIIKNDPVFFKTGATEAGNPMDLTCQLAVKCF